MDRLYPNHPLPAISHAGAAPALPSIEKTVDVPKGKVVGVRQVAQGFSAAGQVNVDLKLEMYLGAPDSVDTVSIKGTPD